MKTCAVPTETWHGCYDESWRDLIVPEAFAHPAKMARGLIAKIFDHLFAIGALKRGDTVCDPFGGIGTTAIEGASRGVQVVCCELEPKFVELARSNFALHERDWTAMGRPMPTIVQGDSRKLRERVGPVLAECVLSSPPYAKANGHPSLGHPELQPGAGDLLKRCTTGARPGDDRYGTTPGQIETLPEGTVAAVIASPPYAEIASGSGGLNTKPAKHEGQQSGRSASAASQDTDSRYGESAGQLARMSLGDVDAIVSSPPFTQGYSGGGGINRVGYRKDGVIDDKVGERTYQGTAAEREPGNLETLTLGAVDAVVTSPPYTGEVAPHRNGIDCSKFAPGVKTGGPNSQARSQGYGETEGQLGGLRSDETFWSAAKQIVQESFAILRPGGTAVWVVKHFVRDKALVDFPGDWQKLCEHVGFETFLEVHASLVHEEVRSHLFDGQVTKRRERKSFFRRLAEKKGSPRIDFETVYFMRKPEAA